MDFLLDENLLDPLALFCESRTGRTCENREIFVGAVLPKYFFSNVDEWPYYPEIMISVKNIMELKLSQKKNNFNAL